MGHKGKRTFIIVPLVLFLFGTVASLAFLGERASPGMVLPDGTSGQSALSWYQRWNITWGGAENEYATDILATGDLVYMTGTTYSYGAGLPGWPNAFIASFATNGQQMWYSAWGGTQLETGRSVAVYEDAVYMAGETFSYGPGTPSLGNAFIAKYALNGTMLWNTTWGGTQHDGAYAMAAGSDGIYMTGYTKSFGSGGSDAFITKYASNGTLLWAEYWGGPNDDYGNNIAVMADGFYITGETKSFGTGIPTKSNAFVAKYWSNGTMLWNTTWGGSSDDAAYGIDVSKPEEGVQDVHEFYISGVTKSFGPGTP
ncbi:MAG: hypothetical protein JW839_20775, partial [Candidatus Lokiarchaeota archaeon]|nr:hypothetical protein [Candidatus Lokiarchaeota archaeon]